MPYYLGDGIYVKLSVHSQWAAYCNAIFLCNLDEEIGNRVRSQRAASVFASAIGGLGALSAAQLFVPFFRQALHLILIQISSLANIAKFSRRRLYFERSR